VHAVFENLLGCPIQLHPHPEFSGAMGAAFAALEELSQGAPCHSVQLNRLQLGGRVESVGCRRCENSCDIRKVISGNRRPVYFGGVCGRFDGAALNPAAGEDAFSIRERLLHDSVANPSGTCFRGELGIPMTLTLSDYLPFWGTFFRYLGYRTHFSGATNRSIVEAGLRRVPAEFCYPIKILFGHVYDLVGRGIRKIFIPHLRMFAPPGEKSQRYACPYTQAAPYVVRENVAPDAEILTFEYPVKGETSQWAETLSKALGISRAEVESARGAAQAAQDAFRTRCRAEGETLLSRLKKDQKRGAVLLGRPYNTTDRHVTLELARRLKALGVEPIPFDFLPLGREPLPPLWERIRWGYGRKLVQAARALKLHPNLGAVIVTNFGCGPDAFVDQYLEAELKDVPHLLLELDDHQAEAGLVTRIEAFVRNFKARSSPLPPLSGKDPGKPRRPLKEYTYYVPAFMDHAYAITGALKASGCKTVLLPPTDDYSWNLGLRHAYGRECHPFIAFAGDLLKAAERPGFAAEEACYFGPSYFGPCLLPQYPLALHLILEKMGLAGVTVMNITDPTNMKELGSPYMVRLAIGLYAIDRFYKWKTEIEPYESEKGSVRRVYQEILTDLEKGLAQGEFFRTLKRSIARFSAIPLMPTVGTRPRVGIVGDVYTRVNPHSNDHLYEKLNQMGFDVWTSGSVIDVSFLAMEQRHSELYRQGKSVKAAAAKALIPALKSARRLIDRNFPKSILTPQERHYSDVHRASSRYVSYWIDKVLSLNLNRIEELHQAGADGIVNVMCHNCMLGTVTASLSKSIRSDIDDTPLCSLVYEGLKSTHTINRLEAFAYQVRSFRTTRSGEKN
jgi:predicted nucleotide-binding protein (sugar kinase/HSP70/actin superfamily)